MSRFIKKLVATVLFLIVASGIFFYFFLENIITKTLNDKIEIAFGSYYHLEYESEVTSLNGLKINFNFHQVKFSTDTLLNSPFQHYPILFFESANFKVQGISVIDLLLNKSINIEQLELDQPKLLILNKENKQQSIQGVQSASTSLKKSKTSLKSISLGTLSILNGHGEMVSYENQADTLYSTKEISIQINGLKTNLSSNIIDPSSFKLEDIDLKLDQLFLNPSFSTYKFLVDKSHFELKKGRLVSSGIKVFPKKSFYQTSIESKYRETLFNIKIDTLLCESEHFLKIFTDKIFKTKNIELTNVVAYFFENTNIKKEGNIIKPLINESILNIPFDLDIDSIRINNGFIEYQFLSKNSKVPASMEFTELNGHITNIRKSSKKADTVKIFLESKFMHQAPFTFIAEYPLSNINYQYYSGHIGSIPFASFEPMFRGAHEIKFKKGQVNNIFFTGIADNHSTFGQLIFDYKDLKIQLMSKKHKKQWLKSSVVNLLVRNDGRTDKEDNAQHVDFEYLRPNSVGQFGLYAHGIMDGLAQLILPKSIYKGNKKQK